jgi:hypothetical protein
MARPLPVPGLSPADQHKLDRASAYDFAKLFISSMITTCAGALLAFLAFLGQRKSLDPSTLVLGLAALVALGLALFGALGAAAAAYFNQAYLAFWGEKPWLTSAAIGAGVASLGLLLIGAGLALWAVCAAL